MQIYQEKLEQALFSKVWSVHKKNEKHVKICEEVQLEVHENLFTLPT